ncbi:hypothetical protein A2348_03475 [Candidatus Uhrbacteria bacterium RIFOXYB12_FULL_58_10]|nr:MAG: hypothetical protein A2348_03475 [Candidatus Uhrbacteria bacterium RIFOXYB12_FULL_58_10]OGL99742.1 MAG: hypothetical protein A2501_00310 [Candidatus Uhrbacteria bacterium RIFOXYC12_FULL_57_11]
MAIKDEGLKARFAAFVAALGKPEDHIEVALRGELGDTIDDAAVNNLGDSDITPDADLLAALTGAGVARATARAAIKGIRNVPAPVEAAPAVAAANGRAERQLALLPVLKDDTSFVAALASGGTAKMPTEDAVAAIRAAFASRTGLYEILPKLLDMMKQRADEMEEPLDESFYSLRKEVARRRYADVLAAFDGIGELITDKEKAKFLDRVEQLWTVLEVFQQQLEAYRQAYKDDSGDIGAAIAAIRDGGVAIDMPDVGPVVAAARGVLERFNRAFAGLGIPVARALAADAIRTREILRRPGLPATIGATTFDEMLKKLEVNIPPDVAEMETSVARYVLSLMSLPSSPVEQQPQFILALQRLGKPIPWATLAQPRLARTAPPATRSRGSEREEPPRRY